MQFVPPECAIPLVPGSIFLVFASPDPAAPSVLGSNGCAGTRPYLFEPGGEPQGFDDVPGRFLMSQLDALSGMAVIRDFAANHPDTSDSANERLVGMLDLAALAHGGTVAVWENPRLDSAVLAIVSIYAEVESREVEYEVGAATGFARVNGWTKIRLSDGRFGWVSPEGAGTWFPYDELVVNRLNYLTGDWSGHVWPEPGAGIPARSTLKDTTGREEYAAEVRESADLAGTLWLRVAVFESSPCETGDPRVVISGWIPAYGQTGDPVAWFFSRGC
jgi:hypothetical protein